MDIRAERMVDMAPDYYQQARSYITIQEAIAQELNVQEWNGEDLQKQLRVATATWGLRYWEEAVGLPVRSTNDYGLRRSRVLGRLRSGGSFSAAMLKAVAESYTQRPVDIEIEVNEYQVYMYLYHEFITEPSFFSQIENIIHAHLGIEYRVIFEYERKQELHQEYKRWTYPLLIVDTFKAGTMPDGYSTLGRLYQPIQELMQTYYRNQTPYTFAGNRVAGSSLHFGNLQRDYSKGQELQRAYSRQDSRYMAAGEALVGSFIAATDTQHENKSVSSSTRKELRREYTRSDWRYKLCGRINAGMEVYV